MSGFHEVPRGNGSGVPDPVDQGLQAAFGRSPASPPPSVLRVLQARTGTTLGTLLPDAEGERPTPIVKAIRDPEQRQTLSGRYQVLGEIARGGGGVVYKGRDVDLGPPAPTSL